MLETYDPAWEAKWERVNERVKAIETKPVLGRTPAESIELANLSVLQSRIAEAGCRTANDLIDLYAPYVLLPTRRLGLSFDVPRLPDDTDYDTASAELRTFTDRVNAAVAKASTSTEMPALLTSDRSPLLTWWRALRSRWWR